MAKPSMSFGTRVLFTLLKPGIAVLGRLKAPTKFGSTFAIVCAVLTLLAWPQVRHLQASLAATDDRLAGLAGIDGLQSVTLALREQRRQALLPLLAASAAQESSIAAALQRTTAALAQAEAALQGGERWASAQDWQQVVACAKALPKTPVRDDLEALRTLSTSAACTDRVDALAERVTDRSGLTADADRQHFYVLQLATELEPVWAEAVDAMSMAIVDDDEPGTFMLSASATNWTGPGERWPRFVARVQQKAAEFTREGGTLPPDYAPALGAADALFKYLQAHAARGVMHGADADFARLASTARAAMDRLRERTLSDLRLTYEHTRSQQHTDKIWLLAGVGGFTVLIVYLMLTLTFGIIWGVGRLHRGMARVAGGNLCSRISMPTTDELSDLARYTNQLAEQMQNIVSRLALGSGNVAKAGETMSISAQMLAIRTDSQSSRLQDTSTSVRGVVTQVEEAARRAGEIDQQCSALQDQTGAGMAVVEHAVDTIQRIAKQSASMTEVIMLIESIAFQTNILALNAAVEAARAGESGRGFAVVAAEVRSLALRTGAAATDVKKQIALANEQVGDGVREIGGVKATLERILDGVRLVATRMRDVATDSAAQSKALGEIMRELDGVQELTQANAGMVAEAVAAAEGMRDNAQELRSVISGIQFEPAGAPPQDQRGQAVGAPAPASNTVDASAHERAPAPAPQPAADRAPRPEIAVAAVEFF